jgi:small subunit ribosomal protein S16
LTRPNFGKSSSSFSEFSRIPKHGLKDQTSEGWSYPQSHLPHSGRSRDGRFVEKLGTYIPRAQGQQIELTLDVERADYWTSVGAKATETVGGLIKRARKEAPAAVEAEA